MLELCVRLLLSIALAPRGKQSNSHTGTVRPGQGRSGGPALSSVPPAQRTTAFLAVVVAQGHGRHVGRGGGGTRTVCVLLKDCAQAAAAALALLLLCFATTRRDHSQKQASKSLRSVPACLTTRKLLQSPRELPRSVFSITDTQPVVFCCCCFLLYPLSFSTSLIHWH